MSGMPDLQLALRDPSPRDLRRLLRRVRQRDDITLLEQVAREVGPVVYADVLPRLYDATVLIRRDRIVGLPPGTYAMLLEDVLARRRWARHRSSGHLP